MITEDKIAAAQIAQLFGSELLRVQEGARTDSGSIPSIVNIDPKSFLMSSNSNSYSNPTTQAKEKFLYEQLQKEAESQCPLPPEEFNTQQNYQPSSPIVSSIPQTVTTTLIPQIAPSNNPVSENSFEKIANCLERIANSLDRIELVAKKKKVRRISK